MIWLNTEERSLKALCARGATKAEISSVLTRHTWAAISSRITYLKLRRPRRLRVSPGLMHELVRTLVRRRKELGLSQTRVAELTDLDRTSLNRFELVSTRRPSLAMIERYAGAVGLKLLLVPNICETTLTERFYNPDCECATYPGNLGPCRTYEEGAQGRCVYCDHERACHVVGVSDAAQRTAQTPAQEAPAP